MKKMLFNLFKRFFSDDIDELISIQAKKHSDVLYQHWKEYDLEKTKEHYESLVDKRATDKFSQINFLVNPRHVFQITKTGIPYVGMEPITKKKATQLRGEAKTIKSMQLWPIIANTLREKATEIGFKQAVNWDGVLPGKMMVYNLDIIEGIIDYLDTIQVDKLVDGTKSAIVK